MTERAAPPPSAGDGRDAALSVSHLSKAFGDRLAFDDVSFDVGRGEVFGFLGPNGAGKTTTMRVMVGLTPATHGEVTIGGLHYPQIPNPGRHVGVLLDASAQHAGRTGREVLEIGARTMGLPSTRIDEMLDLKIELEFVRDAKRISRGRERVETLKEEKEEERRFAGRTHVPQQAYRRANVQNGPRSRADASTASAIFANSHARSGGSDCQGQCTRRPPSARRCGLFEPRCVGSDVERWLQRAVAWNDNAPQVSPAFRCSR